MKKKQALPAPVVKTTKKKGRSDDFDVHVGARLKLFRAARGISQSDLAKQIDVTFQQLQKYEQGMNRVSATRLYQIAGILNVSLSSFFDGYEGSKNPKEESKDTIDKFTSDGDLAKLFSYWQAIKDPALKKSLLSLLKNYIQKE